MGLCAYGSSPTAGWEMTECLLPLDHPIFRLNGGTDGRRWRGCRTTTPSAFPSGPIGAIIGRVTETVELSIEVPSGTKRAIERAASQRGLSVSDFIQEALRRYLEEAGNLKNRRPTPR